MKKNNAMIIFTVIPLLALLTLISCKKENVDELVVWDKNIDGVAVSPLPEIESSGGTNGIVGYKNRAAFSGELAEIQVEKTTSSFSPPASLLSPDTTEDPLEVSSDASASFTEPNFN